MTEEEKRIIDECDIVVWYKLDEISMNSRYIKASPKGRKAKNKELGPKYNIVLFKEDKDNPENADMFSAIIGDTMGYVERIGTIGYSGVMFRENTLKSTDARKTIVDILDMFGFCEKDIKKILKTAV